jgi:plastocyanin
MIVILISLLAALAMLSSCGGGATVTMKELKFDPDAVTIKKGETVTWKNEDRRDRQIMSGHPPVMTDEFMSPVLKTGESWSFSFGTAGEYPYHDMMIPGLLGRIVVEE